MVTTLNGSLDRKTAAVDSEDCQVTGDEDQLGSVWCQRHICWGIDGYNRIVGDSGNEFMWV